MNDHRIDDLKKKASELGIEMSERQAQQFITYYELLVEWNSFMNLTAITEYDEVILKHFIDSISLMKYVDLSGDKKLIDIGTGAGFPGIPLKIMFPDLKITLLDSLNKRIKFLNEVIEKLELTDVETIHGRAEDFSREKKYREVYDFAVSRAVANLATLSELCIPFVKENGYFIPYKSEKTDEEVSQGSVAIRLLGGNLENTIRYSLPNTDMSRTLLLIKKEKKTSAKYPRKAGTPAKMPLGVEVD